MKTIAVLTGAGISAESGINTFRDNGGLWENRDVMEVASPQGWRKNRELVLEFYNERRRQLHKVQPNKGHTALVELEEKYNVQIITQNVDDLHERAGSSNVLHIHGELLKVRSTTNEKLVYDWPGDLTSDDKCDMGSQLRPHIVWFGEAVPLLSDAAKLVERADIVAIVGTSMQVYPAAGLVGYALPGAPIYYIDPNPNSSYELMMRSNVTLFREKASVGVPQLVEELMGRD